VWVKLCANTSLRDARLCAAAGADAVGFIFARGSKRMVRPSEVAPVSKKLLREFPQVERIGVFTEGPATSIASAVELCGLTAVQLQGDDAQAETAALRKLLPGIKIIAAFAWAGSADFAHRLAHDEHDRVMVDSSSAKSHGGTGKVFDWQQAAPSFSAARDGKYPAIAAGGLTPENVTEAITILRPWGVDVASGVESMPGQKDPAKVARFIAAARGAR
jgi:phosphoribosylanthranilate isomerase